MANGERSIALDITPMLDYIIIVIMTNSVILRSQYIDKLYLKLRLVNLLV